MLWDKTCVYSAMSHSSSAQSTRNFGIVSFLRPATVSDVEMLFKNRHEHRCCACPSRPAYILATYYGTLLVVYSLYKNEDDRTRHECTSLRMFGATSCSVWRQSSRTGNYTTPSYSSGAPSRVSLGTVLKNARHNFSALPCHAKETSGSDHEMGFVRYSSFPFQGPTPERS